MQATAKHFDEPDTLREFSRGRFEIVRLGGMAIGRATYQPGWRWSVDVGAENGEEHCQVEHVGMVMAGRMAAAMLGGAVTEYGPGELFHVPPGHDSWVVGDEPYVSLHFLGADEYMGKK